ncbi:hypothetical protein EDWATA_01350 [Edwardsiella tarda ATCC 23685]|uniref:Uncharacterized protein n=1 Tax=Edwardsiella tarda ATCC 23685 TaxID=500638 RepID=D4F3N7_EDWTA|nr:hypothetical protein EDWATA_01350 [Edwardsiella tarda ATCC 23685]
MMNSSPKCKYNLFVFEWESSFLAFNISVLMKLLDFIKFKRWFMAMNTHLNLNKTLLNKSNFC